MHLEQPDKYPWLRSPSHRKNTCPSSKIHALSAILPGAVFRHETSVLLLLKAISQLTDLVDSDRKRSPALKTLTYERGNVFFVGRYQTEFAMLTVDKTK